MTFHDNFRSVNDHCGRFNHISSHLGHSLEKVDDYTMMINNLNTNRSEFGTGDKLRMIDSVAVAPNQRIWNS